MKLINSYLDGIEEILLDINSRVYEQYTFKGKNLEEVLAKVRESVAENSEQWNDEELNKEEDGVPEELFRSLVEEIIYENYESYDPEIVEKEYFDSRMEINRSDI